MLQRMVMVTTKEAAMNPVIQNKIKVQVKLMTL